MTVNTVDALNWSSAWSAAVQRPSSGFAENWAERGFDHHSVRQVVRLTGGGTALRIRLSNRYGAEPLTVRSATVALSAGGAAVKPGTVRELAFAGDASVWIPAGAETMTDLVELTVEPFASVAVTLYFDGPTGPSTFHAQAWTDSYRAAGDHTADPGGEHFAEVTRSWYYLSDVEVADVGPVQEAVVAFGDSLTDGFGSTVGTNHRYPDALAERLAASGRRWAVLNQGIGGNLTLHDSPWFGERGLGRFERDVLAKPGVRSVIVQLGLNDIGFSEVDLPTYRPNPEVSPEQLIAGYRELIERAHARGVRVIGATITPFKGSEYFTARAEAKRLAVNEWIRTSGAYDAVADFAAVLAAPGDRELLNPAYDFGDRKHPGDAGFRLMAEAVDLAAL
ncbi:SGNH/GDSL hydrolase family protein [Streptomyces sp. NPDC052396]|uniref:SGNH/GDSL hydrolase family protein n=1 Tax=Streptomyces sp. NPDC052396 TaxID=3365689 RepID=UPI0037CD5917